MLLSDHNFRKLRQKWALARMDQKDIEDREAQENVLMALGKKPQEAKLGRWQ